MLAGMPSSFSKTVSTPATPFTSGCLADVCARASPGWPSWQDLEQNILCETQLQAPLPLKLMACNRSAVL